MFWDGVSIVVVWLVIGILGYCLYLGLIIIIGMILKDEDLIKYDPTCELCQFDMHKCVICGAPCSHRDAMVHNYCVYQEVV